MCFRERSLFSGLFSYGDFLPEISDVIKAMEKPMGFGLFSECLFFEGRDALCRCFLAGRYGSVDTVQLTSDQEKINYSS